MEMPSNFYLLFRRLAFCFLVLFSLGSIYSQAWSFGSAKLPCTVPTGLYKARRLGAGFDALDIAVNSSGEVQGSYRLSTDSEVHQSPVIYETWLDSKTSYITCNGNTIDISTSDSRHSLVLSLVWNRLLMELQVLGSYVGDPSWTRWGIKNGLGLATSAALLYSMYFVYQHQQDAEFFVNLWSGEITDEEAAIVAAEWVTGSGWGNFFSRSWLGLRGGIDALLLRTNWKEALTQRYFLVNYLERFTVPAIGGIAGMLTTPFISNYSTYSLNGLGRQFSAGQKEKVCTIPPGVYFGEVIDPSQGSITVTIPVSESKSKDQSGRVTALTGETTIYDIEPSTFVCQGNEIILKWDNSLPASKGAMSAFYDEEKGLLVGTGYFAISGWVRYSTPIPLPSVQFIREDERLGL